MPSAPEPILLDPERLTKNDVHYSIDYDAIFDPVRLAWLERGAVIAFSHVCGGGGMARNGSAPVTS
jgi:hypothetical protein